MKRVRLGEISTIIMGQSPASSTYNTSAQGIPFFQGNADFGEYEPVVRTWCTAPTKMACAKDLLISVRAPIGAMNVANQACCIGRGLAALRVDETRCLRSYLWHALQASVDELQRKGAGTTFPAIGRQALEETEIPLPSLPEQRHIADVLNKVDALIANYRRQLTLLDALIQSRFHELFGDMVSNSKHWPIRRLSDIAKYYNGLNYKPSDVSLNGTIVLRAGNIQNQALVLNDTVRVEMPIKERYLVKENDILMCACNGSAQLVGKSAIIPKLPEPMYFGSFMKIIRTPYPEYVQAFFQTPAFRRQIRTAKTTTINQITNQMMDLIELPLPPSSLIEDFSTQLEGIKEQKVSVQASLLVAETLQASLKQRYFSVEGECEND